MGEIAEAMLDGTLCAGCGEFLGSDAGYPVMCAYCRRAERSEPRIPSFSRYKVKPSPRAEAGKIACPVCQKRVKAAGLGDHVRDVHPETQAKPPGGLLI